MKLPLRPDWLPFIIEIEARQMYGDGMKLNAVKHLLQYSKEKGIEREVFGLKIAKEYIEALGPLNKDVFYAAKEHLEFIEDTEELLSRLISQIPEMNKIAFPWMTDEHAERCMTDREFYKRILKVQTSTKRFGI